MPRKLSFSLFLWMRQLIFKVAKNCRLSIYRYVKLAKKHAGAEIEAT